MKEVDRLFSFWTPWRQEAEHYDTNCRYIVTEWPNQSSLSMLVCVYVCECVVEDGQELRGELLKSNT